MPSAPRRRIVPRGRGAILFWLAVVLAWEVCSGLVALSGTPLAQTKLPYPHMILLTMAVEGPLLGSAALSTSKTALTGLLVGAGIGFGIALLMTLARWIEDAIFPYIVAAQMIPTIALGPIILTTVKDADVTRILVAAYIAFFSVSLSSIKGLKSVPPQCLELLATYNASLVQTYFKIRIPASLPFFFAGLKVGAPLSVVGAIVVELAGAKAGLGFLILTTQYYGSNYAYLFWAALCVTMLLGYAFAWAAGRLERLASPWQPEFRSESAGRAE